MSGTTTKGEKFKAAFGVISKNVLADRKKQVGLVIKQLEDAMASLGDSTQKAQLAYHPGKKGNAEVYKPLRERLDTVETGRNEKEAFAECGKIEAQAKAALKSVPALLEADKQQATMNGKSKDDLDKLVAALGNKVTSTKDQGTMIAAIKARYGLDELAGELTSNALPRLYKALALVPDNHTRDNPMFQKLARSKMSDTSLYFPGGSGQLAINGGEAGPFSSEKEKYTDGAGKKMEFNRFDAHTLHEVGHSVDDAAGYMAKHGTGASYGGWKPSDASEAADAGARLLAKNWPNLSYELSNDVITKLTSDQSADVAINGYKTKQNAFNAITADGLRDDGAMKAADTAVKQLRDTVTVPLSDTDKGQVENAMNLTQLMKLSTAAGPAKLLIINLIKEMKTTMATADQVIRKLDASLKAANDPKQMTKFKAEAEAWVKAISKELWWAGSSTITKVAVEGKVYQRDDKKWWRYELSARNQMLKDYQFRSPSEWFAEVYTVAMLGKLSKGHPCFGDIKTIDTTQKIT